MTRPTIRKYELLVWLSERGQRDGDPETSEHQTRGAAELAAEKALEACPAGDAQVWAQTDDGGFLVYRLEGVPAGQLETRLRARLRHPRPINQKQYACLTTIADGGGQAVDGAKIRRAMGRYATNSFNSCGLRGWIVEESPTSDRWKLTKLGAAVLQEQQELVAQFRRTYARTPAAMHA